MLINRPEPPYRGSSGLLIKAGLGCVLEWRWVAVSAIFGKSIRIADAHGHPGPSNNITDANQECSPEHSTNRKPSDLVVRVRACTR
jgi:hypothetical protein